MFFVSATARTAGFASTTSGARGQLAGIHSIGAGHGTPSQQTAYPEARWRPLRTLDAFTRNITSATDFHIPMPVAAGTPPTVVTPTAALVDVFASTPTVVLATILLPSAGLVDVVASTPLIVLQTQLTPSAGLVDVIAPTLDILAPRAIDLLGALIDVHAPTPLVVLRTDVTPSAGLVDVTAPTPAVVLATLITPTAGLIDVTAGTPTVVLNPVISLDAGLIAVTAPALSLNLGMRTLLLTAASFAVVAPTIRVLTALPGLSLAALDLPDVTTPNVITQTTYEITVMGALGLPAVTCPAVSIDLTKRLYVTTRPLFGYAPNGQIPVARDTGVYLSPDLGATWHDLSLPDFPLQCDFRSPIFIDRDGHRYLFFGDTRGQVGRYDLTTRTLRTATFTGPADDLALTRETFGIAVEPGASQIVLYAGGFYVGVWRSTDNGATFALANTGQELDSLAGDAVVFHPTVPGLCYAGGARGPRAARTHGEAYSIGAPLYRSTDSGAHWELMSVLPLEEGGIHKIAVGTDPDIVYMRTQTSLRKSTNQGATSSQIHTGLPPVPFGQVNALAVSLSDPDVLYTAIGRLGAIPTPSAVYKSVDAGATWTLSYELLLGGPVIMEGLAIHRTDPDRAAVATFGKRFVGVYATDGTTWARTGGATQADLMFRLFGVTYGPEAWMAATGGHVPSNGNRPQKIQIGTENLYGEMHEATVTLPYAAAFVAAVTARTVVSLLPNTPPVFPRLTIDMVRHYRTGAREKIRLAEVQLERLDGRQGSSDRQLTLFGRATHAAIARGPRAVRVVPLQNIEQITDDAADFSVTLPGIHTDWQTYDTILVNGRSVRLSAVRYSITTDRRMTILGTAATNSAALDPDAASADAHPRILVGQTPTSTRRSTPARKQLVWSRG